MTEVQAWHVVGQAEPIQRQSKAKLRLRMYLMMVLTDIIAISCAFSLAAHLQALQSGNGVTSEQLAMIVPLYVVTALLHRAYSPTIVHDRWTSVGRAINALALATGAIMLVAFFLRTSMDWSRSALAASVALSVLLLMVARYVFVRYADVLLGGDPYQIVVVCDGALPAHRNSSHRVIMIPSSDAFDLSQLDPANYSNFANAIRDADRVIVHCPAERRHFWAMALKGANVQGEVIAPEIEILHPTGVARHNGVPTLIVSRGPLALKDRLIKRAFDVAVAGIALFLLFPLLLVVALCIYLQDRGPVFFVQMRVGRSNRLFNILKFRSMGVASMDSAGTRSASRDDDRITSIGKLIRATSIDELPQLINVLKGDMSIVGPRPHALGSTAENQLFWHIDERYWHRHAMKPGLTGLAQVRGYRGATLRKEDLVNRLQSDLEYLNNWTIWRDILILIRTASVVLHRNAF